MMILSPDLAAIQGVRHAYFTREGGVSGGLYASLNGGMGSADERDSVLANRARMAARLGVLPERLLSLHQIHSADVIVPDGPWRGERPKADAMATDRPGLALGVLSADCGPILFADPEARVIGAAHSGWKGALDGVGASTLAAMERLGARRERVVAVLGPTISREAYEVGPEFVERLMTRAADADRFLAPSPRPGHAMFDLPAFIGASLAAAGVGRFVDLGLCTYADEARFYSYRRSTHRGEADYGRLVSAIVIEEG